MCFTKVKNSLKKLFTQRYAKRRRNFYSSSIAGLFTGVAIGIFFSLVTDVNFNRWIDLFSYEIFPATIYFLLTLFVIFFLYHVGKFCMKFLILRKVVSSKSKELIGFRINYFAGIYSATWGASLLILYNETSFLIYVMIAFIVFYVPIGYMAVKTKAPK